jgi:photosynthetic reaction center cytochrome c subunit
VNLSRAVTGFLLLLSFVSAAAQETKQPEKPKLAGDIFKNVQVLKDLPEDQFWATMSFFADSLGVNCERCHATPFEADKKPEKIKARQMLLMVRDLNERYFGGTRKITCNSCHRGTTIPVAQPSLDAQRWMDFARVEDPLPGGAGLIARYQKLTGVAAVAAPHPERVSYQMTTYLSEAPPSIEATELTTGGPHQFRIGRHSDSGDQEWIRDGAAGWIHGTNGWQATDGNKMFDVSSEASSFDWETLNDVTEPKTVKMDIARGRPVAIVEAMDHGERVWLYFDQQTGLLLRHRTFFPTYFADGCWDVEFDDYKRVGPVMLPFLVQILNPGGNGLTIRRAKERALLPNLDAKLFTKPESAK